MAELASRVSEAGDPTLAVKPDYDRATEMIYQYSNETQTNWDHGNYKVQLNLPNNPRPMGFCDGSDADVAELQMIAEAEGADEMRIEKKSLKSGREVWTLHGGA